MKLTKNRKNLNLWLYQNLVMNNDIPKLIKEIFDPSPIVDSEVTETVEISNIQEPVMTRYDKFPALRNKILKQSEPDGVGTDNATTELREEGLHTGDT
jgi:hypothetical protein